MAARLNTSTKYLQNLAGSMLLLLSAQALANDSRIAMKPVSLAEWQQQLQDYRGNILVVDMWATWCTSCIERFPKMVKLNKKYAQRDVRIVSMNLDDRGDKESLQAANRFLNNIGADFSHFHMDENLMLAFEKLDLIGIPVVLIYDSKGVERYRMTGDNPYKQFTDKDIDIAINKLLNESSL